MRKELGIAAREGDVKQVRTVLKSGVNDAVKNDALRTAAHSKSIALCK